MFPFISALSQAGGIIVDKIVLTRRQVSLRVFVPILFLFLFLLTAICYPFLGKISADFFQPYYLWLFLAMITVAIVWNVYYYRGVQAEKIHEFELIVIFQPILTILLATIFIKGERNLQLEIASIIAALALITAHIKKNHFVFSSNSLGLILAVILMSIELIIIDYLLDVLSPVALYAVRTGIIFIFFLFYYKPHLKMVADHNFGLIFLTSALGTIQMVTKFYGFQEFGVIYTSLILILSPVLVYIISTIFLHENLKMRTIVSVLVILGCIVYATLLAR